MMTDAKVYDDAKIPTKIVRIEESNFWSKSQHKVKKNEDEANNRGFVAAIIVFGSIILVILTLPISLFFCFKVVKQYEKMLIFRLGRIRSGKPRGPGLFFVLPCTDKSVILDMRVTTVEVEPQEILTKDAVTITIEAVVFYRVEDPKKVILKLYNYKLTTKLIAITALRNIIGNTDLYQLIAERQAIMETLQQLLDVCTEPWGIEVQHVGIKNIKMPAEIQRAMAAEGAASREARAKLVAAEGEKTASEFFMKAANVSKKNPGALKLRYLQTINTIGGEQHVTTLFYPLPMDIVNPYLKKKDDWWKLC